MLPFRFPQHHFSRAFFASLSDIPPPNVPVELSIKSPLPQNLVYLYQLCRKLEVKSVIEVGTGVSTEMMKLAGVEKIETCDRDGVPGDGRFVCEATEMLQELRYAPDLFFLDGRLNKTDFHEIQRLSRQDTWYALDDFHGLEKGVSNAYGIFSSGRILMVPVDGPYGRSTFAVIAPVGQLSATIYG